MNPRGECLDYVKSEGFVFLEHGAKHDRYYSSELNYTITIKRSHFTEDDTRMIKQEIRRERRKQGK